ncbi:hypothetical protein POSPLADRAFT_1156658 [Postia placenta MAD-698-R-SB12]|uniref:DHHA2 domain-containing protein n=1 Tax=Postia placenta MAD-698-R-SB12 TaxID=670580 RepID=A0A1X6MLV6_9APHY|nr:hypothetical protein POSPLADRAFT_1156658 [Postia placenta MAD-698-R-SB12]OSX57360.1 hypothetical protein POSPLADRAFT_1156658 [Postia placenta MAD-698-R-SB12]
MPLSGFLGNSKQAYLDGVKESEGQEWTIVMGNEAGDLDSVASAVAYAWYIYTILKEPSVALMQTPRTDLHLRAENLHALSLAGLSPADLLCIDDVPYKRPGPFPSTKFALVDHNRLQGQFTQENHGARVVAVVDHHEDEGFYKDTADPRIITTGIGSCASIVACYLEEKCRDHIPPELASLLLSAIVVDTSGLLPGKKAVEIDHRAATFLASRSKPPVLSDAAAFIAAPVPSLHELPALRELSDTLQTKKASVSHLRTRDLLRRDYKEYALTSSWASGGAVLIGLASVPVGLAAWLPLEGSSEFSRATRAWMDERGLTALGVLTSFRDDHKPGQSGRGKHRREQLWVVRAGNKAGEELGERLFRGLEASEQLRLKDKKWKKVGVEEGAGFGESWRVRVWKQKNADATRKATAPIMKAIIEGDHGAQGLQSGL